MIERETVKKMAHLARIELDAEEERALTGDLERILGYIENLKEVNVEGVEEVESASGVNSFRQDSAAPEANELLMKGVPRAEHGFISVKKIIEK